MKRKPPSKEANRARQLRCRYGITPEQFDKMLIQQNNGCAICSGLPPPGKPFFVDHNHATKNVRGLLCARCNTLVGYIETNRNLLGAVENYIYKWNALARLELILKDEEV